MIISSEAMGVAGTIHLEAEVRAVGLDQRRQTGVALEQLAPVVEKRPPLAVSQDGGQAEFVREPDPSAGITVAVGEHVRPVEFLVQVRGGDGRMLSSKPSLLVGGLVWVYGLRMKVEEPAAGYGVRVPASPEVVALATELVRKFSECFWFRHPDARVRYEDDVELVVEHLREYGDKRAWAAARELKRCL